MNQELWFEKMQTKVGSQSTNSPCSEYGFSTSPQQRKESLFSIVYQQKESQKDKNKMFTWNFWKQMPEIAIVIMDWDSSSPAKKDFDCFIQEQRISIRQTIQMESVKSCR